MNGLCEHCQVYYPMPPDFAEGVAYTCPACGSGLVPYLPPDPVPADPDPPLGQRPVDWEPLDPPEVPADEALDASPPPPGHEDPLADTTLHLEVDLEEGPHPWAELPAEVGRPDLQGEVPVVRYHRAAASAEVPATRFLHRGAGDGVSVEELPRMTSRPQDAGWEVARPSARRPAGPGRGRTVAILLGLALLGSAAVGYLALRPVPAGDPEEAPGTPEAASAPAAGEAPTSSEAPGPGSPQEASHPAAPPAAPPEAAPSEPGPRELRARSLARVRTGNGHLTAGRVDAAIQAFEQALLLDPENGFAHRGLGIAYARLGRAAEAAQEYELYLRFVPDAPDAEEARRYIEGYEARRK